MTFEEYLEQAFSNMRDNKLTEAMKYALLGGKHFRPALIFAVTDGFNIEREEAYPAALALEMVHSYSLIHDDLPCMDNDDLRRGKPTVHKAFGEDIAVLAGDALLTHAFNVISEADYDDHTKVRMIQELSNLAGLGGMVHGQYLDMFYTGKDINEAILDEIEDYKTGGLFECALVFGMLLGNDEENLAFYASMALKIGRVFQLQDDLFEITKTEEELGKNASDVDNDKASALSVYTKEELEERIAKLFEEMFEQLEYAKFNTDELRKIIENMRDR